MIKIKYLLAIIISAIFSFTFSVQAMGENLKPERPIHQKAIYDADHNTVTITAVAPSKTE